MRKCILIILLFFSVNGAFCQRNYKTIRTIISIEGTSNIHDWKSVTKDSKVEMVMTVDTSGLKAIQYLMVDVPVKGIKSSKGPVMDKNTFIALKADKYPSIIYKQEKVTGIEKKGDIYIINTTGSLNVAGVVRKIELTVIGTIKSDGNFYFKFSKKIKMTDYNIKLPSTLFGLIKTANDIELKFNIIAKPV